ncbi:trichohyalin-like isoform X2 [Anopheles albimanus]|uniref:trichohyalin-like isoform X2 n=1 Tax=Anopheles albimanus TaxID=7167 RepID=UPI0016405422|nr:trichohyalin-like isoform X2 [Anopheles albimanus]
MSICRGCQGTCSRSREQCKRSRGKGSSCGKEKTRARVARGSSVPRLPAVNVVFWGLLMVMRCSLNAVFRLRRYFSQLAPSHANGHGSSLPAKRQCVSVVTRTGYRVAGLTLRCTSNGPWFRGALECVNLPRVTAQLEKLMGTNVVRLTDRKYMQELQRRIQEDYNVTLEKRITEREHREWQRQKQLILNGKYSLENCPKPLIPLHSIVLAKEIERERNLILSGAGDNIPEEMTSSVFLVNQKTNVHILNKREKLKTIREKNAERLIKQGHRWERERLQMEDQSRDREIERRTKREALLEQEKLYMIEENDRSLNLLRVKTKKGPCRDMNLRAMLMQQREELGRTIQKRDFDMHDERGPGTDIEGSNKSEKQRRNRRNRKQHQMQRQHEVHEYQESSSPEEGYISMNNADSPEDLETSLAIKVGKGSKDSGDESDGEQDSDNGPVAGPSAEGADDEQPKAGPSEESAAHDAKETLLELEQQGQQELSEAEAEAAEEARLREELDRTLLEKKKARQVRNEDPKITKLKEADTVADIYNVADEIIVLEKKKTKKGFGK